MSQITGFLHQQRQQNRQMNQEGQMNQMRMATRKCEMFHATEKGSFRHIRLENGCTLLSKTQIVSLLNTIVTLLPTQTFLLRLDQRTSALKLEFKRCSGRSKFSTLPIKKANRKKHIRRNFFNTAVFFLQVDKVQQNGNMEIQK